MPVVIDTPELEIKNTQKHTNLTYRDPPDTQSLSGTLAFYGTRDRHVPGPLTPPSGRRSVSKRVPPR